MSSSIQEYQACERLRPFVELFWEGSFNENSMERISMKVIPNGCLELIIHLNDRHCDLQNAFGWSQSPDYMIVGMHTKPYFIQFGNLVKVFAIRFKPDGFYNIFGVPASVIKDSIEDFSQVIGIKFRDFSQRIKEKKCFKEMISYTESQLLKNLENKIINSNYVSLAAEAIRQTKSLKMKDLPNQVYISMRQLDRQFKEQIGISPKHYMRITRLNEVRRLLNNNCRMDLTSVAYHCGYSDQAHFINEFKSFTGELPTIFIREKNSHISTPGLSHYDPKMVLAASPSK
jgi:AraC-like DNA-binding protein